MAEEWPLFSQLGPLGALATASRLARSYARVVLAGWDLDELADTAQLIVSELVTNAVDASNGPDGQPLYEGGRLAVVHLRLLSDRARLLIEVWDTVPDALGAPVPQETDEYDESGRGLSIVESLSERWAWRRVPGWTGKVTWALMRAELPQLRHRHPSRLRLEVLSSGHCGEYRYCSDLFGGQVVPVQAAGSARRPAGDYFLRGKDQVDAEVVAGLG
jgi:anti-sigma regulatory factor (Ser/Thr protein kinase)